MMRLSVAEFAALKHERVAAMWEDGASVRDIAQAVGLTPEGVRSTVVRLRQDGRELAHRKPGRVAAP
jgi:transposase-like protein